MKALSDNCSIFWFAAIRSMETVYANRSIRCAREFLPIIAILYGPFILGQDNFTGFVEPEIALNYGVTTNYSHNFSVSQRSFWYDDSAELRARQFDINHFSQLKIRLDQSIALGIKYRFRDIFESGSENELRFTQQYNITDRSGNFRFGNRLRTEQRITASQTVHRFRYRFAVDAPLNGEELNVGEAYFVVSTESLLSAGKAIKPEWDQRLTANIGWLLNPETKLQGGFEYRAENFALGTEHVLFFVTGLVFSL